MLIEPLAARRSVVPFNVSILPRFAWLDVLKLNASFASPGCQPVTDVFRPIITADGFGFASPLNRLIQGAFNTL